jgi:hypothetical protein
MATQLSGLESYMLKKSQREKYYLFSLQYLYAIGLFNNDKPKFSLIIYSGMYIAHPSGCRHGQKHLGCM